MKFRGEKTSKYLDIVGALISPHFSFLLLSVGWYIFALKLTQVDVAHFDGLKDDAFVRPQVRTSEEKETERRRWETRMYGEKGCPVYTGWRSDITRVTRRESRSTRRYATKWNFNKAAQGQRVAGRGWSSQWNNGFESRLERRRHFFFRKEQPRRDNYISRRRHGISPEKLVSWPFKGIREKSPERARSQSPN